jgi:hypothetical protein
VLGTLFLCAFSQFFRNFREKLFFSLFSKRDQNRVSGRFIPYKVLTHKNEFFSCSVPLVIFAYPTSEKKFGAKHVLI